MRDAIVIAFIVTGGPLMTALLVSFMSNKQQRERQVADWEREDKVATRVAEAAERLLAANERVADAATETNGKLVVIHDLVNSQYTAALQGELDANVRDLASLRELVAVRTEAGRKPSPSTLAAVKAAESRIKDLKKEVAERIEQDQVTNGSARAKIRAGKKVRK